MKISKFQLIVLGIFAIFIVGGVAAFATYRGSSVDTEIPPVTVWGTFPAETFNRYVSQANLTLPQQITVNYVEKSPAQFSSDFVGELARGRGPDAILLPVDMLLPHVDKLTPIPYTALTERSFRDAFVTEAELYLRPEGILALPFTIDPLIMYWNRDTFDAAGLATYPRYWDEFAGLNQRLTVKDANGNIRKSAVALGDFATVANAREILGALLLQIGNPVTARANDGRTVSALKRVGYPDPQPALEFFTRSVNPSSSDYSWNRGMPNSKSAFLSGMLATYFGFASELADIREKNPNLNFDAAPLPQVRSGGVKATYGRMYGFSIVRATANPNAAFQIMSILTAPQRLAELGTTMYLPTVRRDIIAGGASDPYIQIFNNAALVSRSWLDIDPSVSRQIMSTLVNAITSGSKAMYQALQDAGDQYDVALEQAQPAQ